MLPGASHIQVLLKINIRDVLYIISIVAMYPDPDFAQSEILNDRFVLMDGIVGLTFDEKKGIIYFQPLATDRCVYQYNL